MNLILLFEMSNKYANIIGKWIFATFGGIIAAFEPISAFIFVCFLALLGDVYTSVKLGKRISKCYPDKASGKVQSRKIGQVITTVMKLLFILYLAYQIDILILANTALYITKTTAGIFCFSQIWSMLENESSFSNKKWAKILQRIMIDKTIRHLDLEKNTFDTLKTCKDANTTPRRRRRNKKNIYFH